MDRSADTRRIHVCTNEQVDNGGVRLIKRDVEHGPRRTVDPVVFNITCDTNHGVEVPVRLESLAHCDVVGPELCRHRFADDGYLLRLVVIGGSEVSPDLYERIDCLEVFWPNRVVVDSYAFGLVGWHGRSI